MKKRLLGFGFLILLAVMMSVAFAAGDDWLIGKWELAYDSDNSPKDWLEFTADGHAYGITPEGRRIPGRYVLKNSRIEITYSYNGKMIPLALRYTERKDELLAYSPQTKNTSRYKKVN